jgi:hypothetical protein
MVEKVQITYQGNTKNVPKTYVEGLKGYDRRKQIKSIFEGTFRPKTSLNQKKVLGLKNLMINMVKNLIK